MNIAFVALNLDRGGAERQMVTLAGALAERGHRVSVFVFRGGGAFERDLPEAVELIDLGRRRRGDLPMALFRLVRHVRRIRPDVVHPYLAAPNALVTAIRPALGRTAVVWGLRHAELALDTRPRPVRLAFRLSVALSHCATGHIANSQAGRKWHIDKGFPEDRIRVVPNGIDLHRFKFDPLARAASRFEWGVGDDEFLVGMVARRDRLKDHATFVAAAEILGGSGEAVRFIAVGAEPPGTSSAVEWKPPSDDPAAVYSALDLLCMSSVAEGFPNVPAEAMACGTPCVVTDVGDARSIVGNLGWVVPPRTAAEMAAAIDAARLAKPILRERLRCAIAANWSTELLAERTEAALLELIGGTA